MSLLEIVLSSAAALAILVGLVVAGALLSLASWVIDLWDESRGDPEIRR